MCRVVFLFGYSTTAKWVFKASWLSKAFLGNTKTRSPNFKYPNPSLNDSSTSKDDFHTFFYDVYSNNAYTSTIVRK